MLKLYSYFRSSAAYRVRIALELKGLEKEIIPVDLRKTEQQAAGYRAINPQGLVPALATNKGDLLTQSLAIIEYLEEVCPEPPLMPEEPLARARVRSLACLIAMEIHPLNNLRVLHYLEKHLSAGETTRQQWYQHWVAEGFTAFEASLRSLGCNGQFCVGETPGLADIFLVPQVYNARRFACDLSEYPLITAVSEHCESLPAFQAATPERQLDFSV